MGAQVQVDLVAPLDPQDLVAHQDLQDLQDLQDPVAHQDLQDRLG